MDKSQIADVLLDDNAKDPIPFVLCIDGEKVVLDLVKTTGVVFCGNEAKEKKQNVVEQIASSGKAVRIIQTGEELIGLHQELHQKYSQEAYFTPSCVIVVENVQTLFDDSQKTKEALLDVLRLGHGAHLYFLCSSEEEKLSLELKVNFSDLFEMAYTPDQHNFNAVYVHVGKRQKIMLA